MKLTAEIGKENWSPLRDARILQISPHETFQELKLERIVHQVTGRFQDRLAKILGDFGSPDFVFIGGHLDGEATVGYYEQFARSSGQKSVLVFDHINWSPEMRAAWAHIASCRRGEDAIAVSKMGVIRIGHD